MDLLSEYRRERIWSSTGSLKAIEPMDKFDWNEFQQLQLATSRAIGRGELLVRTIPATVILPLN